MGEALRPEAWGLWNELMVGRLSLLCHKWFLIGFSSMYWPAILAWDRLSSGRNEMVFNDREVGH